jgi:mannosyltransferase OCH1-like enzyme
MRKLLVALVCVVFIAWASIKTSWVEMFDNPDQVVSITSVGLSKPSPTWQSDTIPKIVHQMAPADQAYWHPYWEPCHRTWKTMYPDFIHKMWNDQDIDDFVRTRHKMLYDKFRSFPNNIQRIDMARYLIMYEYGGMYADMDVECMENFYHVLQPGKANFGMTNNADYAYENALMASPAKHPSWHYILSDLINSWHFSSPLQSTGSQMMSQAVNMMPVNMYNPLTNNLIDIGEPSKKGRFSPSKKTENIVAVHHRTASWTTAG